MLWTEDKLQLIMAEWDATAVATTTTVDTEETEE